MGGRGCDTVGEEIKRRCNRGWGGGGGAEQQE